AHFIYIVCIILASAVSLYSLFSSLFLMIRRPSISTLFPYTTLFRSLMIAFNSMGLSYVTDLVGRVLLFVPRVIVAVVILAFGAYLARFVGAAVATYCKGISLPDAAVVGRLAFWAVLVFVVLVALDQLG